MISIFRDSAPFYDELAWKTKSYRAQSLRPPRRSSTQSFKETYMPILSSNAMWEAFGLRALPYAFYGGADIGECIVTIDLIADGSADDWHREWTALADRLVGSAYQSEQRGHVVSAREAYFRAATYYHVSYFPLFGFPVDPRLTAAFDAEVAAFRSAAALATPSIEPVEIPFEGISLPGYFLHAEGSGPRPTIIHVNGYDSNIQEMYFAHGPAAVRRGYNCLLFDGPGQGRSLIRDGLPLRPDWEKVVKVVVDFALTRPEVDSTRVVLAGWSFGGFLAPRAAAFEKRIAALVADPGQWDQREGLKTLPVPEQVLNDLEHADPAIFAPIERHLRSANADPMLQWRIIQRLLWVHGKTNLYDLAKEITRFEISSISAGISCPTLLTAAEGDPIGKGARTLYNSLLCSKSLIDFTLAEGSGGHCEALSRALYHQRIFDWLDETLHHEGRK
jgi:pimeloyl-ACP methyl ester carboxylesterase